MNKPKTLKKGVILLIVIGTILIVITFATILLTIISNQARLSAHQLGRIQAYYASMAGINYAYNRLMNGAWSIPAANATWTFSLVDADFKHPISTVTIVLSGQDVAGCDPPNGVPVCINATADYTLAP